MTALLLDARTLHRMETRNASLTRAQVATHLDAALRATVSPACRYASPPWWLRPRTRLGTLHAPDGPVRLALDATLRAGDTAKILFHAPSRKTPPGPVTLIMRRGHLRQAQIGDGPQARILTVEDWLTDHPFAALAAAIRDHVASGSQR